MNDSTQVNPKKPSFLLRRVVAPHWLQVVLMGTVTFVVINMLVTNPFRLVVAFASCVIFSSLVVAPLRQRANQGSAADDIAVFEAAPTKAAAARVMWDQLRTYQMWLLIVMIALTVLVVLDRTGLIAAP